jgi:hypothetical protein
VSLSLLFGLIPAAFAQSGPFLSVRLNDATIPWVFPPPDGLNGSICSEIPQGININPDDLGSDRVKQAILKVLPRGGKRIVIPDIITGTASDNHGGTYTFVYKNTVSLDFDGTKVKVRMQDLFELKGGNVHYVVGFNWRWAYAANSLDVFEVKDGSGKTVDIAIDPFFFPTDDGVNESPNIIPGSWKKLSTRGDPWNCDPL